MGIGAGLSRTGEPMPQARRFIRTLRTHDRQFENNPSAGPVYDQTMKTITIFKHNGDTFSSYRDIFAVSTENGILSFRWMLKPGDQSTAAKVMTTLPFCLEDDLLS